MKNTDNRSAARVLVSLALLLASSAPAQEWVARGGVYRPVSAVAFDSVRGRAVQIGHGFSELVVSEWDGSGWTSRHRAPTATGYNQMSAVFDPARGRTLFLGHPQPEMWSWDGRNLSSLGAPPFDTTQQFVAAAFDQLRDRLVVQVARATPQTWEYDGASWQLQAGATTPNCSGPSMAFDAIRGRTILFGGYCVSGGYSDDTFEWDGTSWLATQPTTRPPGRSQVVFDTRRGQVVAPSIGTTLWSWDGTDWTANTVPALGATPNAGVFGFDEARQEVMFMDRWKSSTHVLGPTSWRTAEGGVGFVQTTLSTCYSTGTVLGVSSSNSAMSRWDGFGWRDIGSLGMPVRNSAAITTRDWNGSIYLFGGIEDPSILSNQLWQFDGATWSLVNVSGGPIARWQGTLAVDPVRNRLVSFGGKSGGWLNDTYEFDGVQWIPRYPAHAPSPRTVGSSCYDPSRGMVLIFGGDTAPHGVRVNDLWGWDGLDWVQLPSPPIGPAFAQSIAFDPTHMRVVVGASLSGVVTTYALDGSTWTQLPGKLRDGQLATEPLRQTVMAGPETRLLTAMPAQTSSYGASCTGSAGNPSLRAFGEPSVGNASFAGDLFTDQAGPVAGGFGFGTQAANVPLPGGCTLLVDGPALLLILVDNGFGSVHLPIPAVLSLRGLEVFGQGVLLDPGAPGGFVTTNGLRFYCGD